MLFRSAESLRIGALPLGLAHKVKLLNPVKAGQPVRWADVQADETLDAVRLRREMEAAFRGTTRAAAE